MHIVINNILCDAVMAVLLETSKGDIVIDLFVEECPMTCKNFLKLCKCVTSYIHIHVVATGWLLRLMAVLRCIWHSYCCRIKYYNNSLFHNVQRDFLAQTGDPTGTGKGGDSLYA